MDKKPRIMITLIAMAFLLLSFSCTVHRMTQEEAMKFYEKTERRISKDVYQKGVNNDIRDILRKMHKDGDICMLRIKTKASNKRGTVLWGLNISSFGFNDVEGDDEEVEVYEN